MSNYRYQAVQRGKNSKFPDKAEFWILGSGTRPPEWLVDNAAVHGFQGDIPVFKTRATNTGGLIFLDSAEKNELVTVPESESGVIICSRTHGIQGLRGRCFEMVYEIIKIKDNK